jgi:hypothetical protein
VRSRFVGYLEPDGILGPLEAHGRVPEVEEVLARTAPPPDLARRCAARAPARAPATQRTAESRRVLHVLRRRQRRHVVPQGIRVLALAQVVDRPDAIGDAERIEQQHRRVRREVVRHRAELFVEGRPEPLDAHEWNAVGQIREQRLHLAGGNLGRGGRVHDAGTGMVAKRRNEEFLPHGREHERRQRRAVGALRAEPEGLERVDLVPPELDANGLLEVRRKDVDDAAAHGERARILDGADGVVAAIGQRAQARLAVEGATGHHQIALVEQHRPRNRASAQAVGGDHRERPGLIPRQQRELREQLHHRTAVGAQIAVGARLDRRQQHDPGGLPGEKGQIRRDAAGVRGVRGDDHEGATEPRLQGHGEVGRELGVDAGDVHGGVGGRPKSRENALEGENLTHRCQLVERPKTR